MTVIQGDRPTPWLRGYAEDEAALVGRIADRLIEWADKPMTTDPEDDGVYAG